MHTRKRSIVLGILAFGLICFAASGLFKKPANLINTIELVEARLLPVIPDDGQERQVRVKIRNKGNRAIHEVYGNLLLFPKDKSSPETIPDQRLFTADPARLEPGEEWEGQVQIDAREALFLTKLPDADVIAVQLTYAFDRKTARTRSQMNSAGENGQ